MEDWKLQVQTINITQTLSEDWFRHKTWYMGYFC